MPAHKVNNFAALGTLCDFKTQFFYNYNFNMNNQNMFMFLPNSLNHLQAHIHTV
jgi:hypothetical protein